MVKTLKVSIISYEMLVNANNNQKIKINVCLFKEIYFMV